MSAEIIRMVPRHGKGEQHIQMPDYRAYRVLDRELFEQNKDVYANDEFANVFSMAGKFIAQTMVGFADNGDAVALSWNIISKTPEATYQKSLFYRAEGDHYILEDEQNLKNGQRDGLQLAYDKKGALSSVAAYRNGDEICNLKDDLKALRFLDYAKGLLGIKRRDIDTRNQDQLAYLRRVNADMGI